MSKQDFQKGMVAGARPFEEKFDKMSKETGEFAKRANERFDKLDNIMDAVMDDMSDMQKKSLYDLNTPYDLKEDLDDDEKELLSSLLFRISEFAENNEYQQLFIRSVNRYIDISNPQVGFDISRIENIESIKVQKIILQTVMEYFYLEKANFDFLDEYEEVFSYFSVNKKGIDEIKSYIETVYNAVGKVGIAEKYGFVPKEDDPEVEEQIDEKQPAFPEYDGDDISEACADKVNVHPYIVLNDYLVYLDEELQGDTNYQLNERLVNRKKLLVFVHKQNGDEKKVVSDKKEQRVKIDNTSPWGGWGTSLVTWSICGYGNTVFCVSEKGIYSIATDDFCIKEIGFHEITKEADGEYFPQCNETYLVFYKGKHHGNGVLYALNLKNRECKDILSEGPEYGNIEAFQLVGNSMYVFEKAAIHKFDLLTEKKIKIADTDNYIEWSKSRFLGESNTTQYGRYLFSVIGQSMVTNIERRDKCCICNCIELDHDRFMSLHINNTENAITFVASHYIYYVDIGSSMGRYDILTGQYEKIADRSEIVWCFEEGFIRKTTRRYIYRERSSIQVVGKWIYYLKNYMSGGTLCKIKIEI